MKTTPCEAANKYSHPYTPYQIQNELMDAIYDTIDKNYKVGIFESPTGTGKTLSIICSSMTWLRDYKRKNNFDNNQIKDRTAEEEEVREEEDEEEDSDDEPEWVKQAYKSSVLSRSKNRIKDYEVYLDTLEEEYKSNIHSGYKLKDDTRRKRIKLKSKEFQDEDFLPLDYYSDSEQNSTNSANDKIQEEVYQLMKKVDGSSKSKEVEMVNECPVNIYYSSRTHSQLNQFSHQLRLTTFKSSFDELTERTKYLPLASRKHLCINESIRNLSKNDSAINDACIDLQKTKDGCKFLPRADDPLSKKFSDLNFTEIHDIEELEEMGNSLKVCPYYSIRKGLEITEIISLPYQMLFQDSTRNILNLNIKDSIIIIDEAHNILDVLSSLYSVSISIDDLERVIKSLKFYTNRFLKRLNSGNRINLLKLIKLCQLVVKFIQESQKSNKVKLGEEISIEDIFGKSTGDMFNIHKIEAFLSKSKIAYKIESYLEKNHDEFTSSSSNPLLFKIIKFLKTLSNPVNEGKFFWDENNSKTCINYMLLDPSGIFKEIVREARCVLLCGGTMEPVSDYLNYLFPYVPKNEIKTYSCGHIVPPENLKVFRVSNHEGSELSFSFDKRENVNMIINLGLMIIKIASQVPHGMVVFFPSYKYLNRVLEVWKSQQNIFKILSSKKRILQEPQDSSKVEQILNEYTKAIKEEKFGAVLFSVVGGKMSEGINFSDELARAVVMVGLPFPNAYSGEIIAKRKFIESSTLRNGGSQSDANINSRNFYENICMRAVNQSIGRSIRHINDYSVIYLIDSRYESLRIQNKLSGWVRERLDNKLLTCNDILQETKEFFNSKLVSRLN
ncbi:ATP-dependent RNA helicase CHL1 [Scheffersomyces amazonensis]|uniref:ATP-dependent RNA helicase CHL1 n=1 Tax=Scheffersomyces amazonensis TaxID=1078765 RepID=UPI00315D2AA8